jgi:LPS sulfotransferase NodH
MMGVGRSYETHSADSGFLGLLEGVSFDPIFIMGDHRSGTTVLYQLLAATGAFNVVTAYHLLCYDELLSNYINGTEAEAKRKLDEFFRRLGVKDYRFDGVGISPDFPEEYGFALGREHNPHLTSRSVPRLVELCRKVQVISDDGRWTMDDGRQQTVAGKQMASGQEGVSRDPQLRNASVHKNRPILLKNPWDYFVNFMFVKEVFPESRFVFIHRNPLQVINSQVRATRALFAEKNLYHALLAGWYDEMMDRPLQARLGRLLFSERFGVAFRTVHRHVVRASDYFLENVGSLPDTDYISVRYEALCERPTDVVRTVLSFLGVAEQRGVDYEAMIRTRPSPLVPEVARNRTAILRRLEAYLVFCGYTVEALKGAA